MAGRDRSGDPKRGLSEKLRKSMGEAARKKTANLEVLKQAETD